MAEELVSVARLAAGREYIDTLASLGFDPEGALWSMRENEPKSLELSLFTSLVDRVGPKAVLEALFAAYDKALTPRNFDPWDVSVYSPGMQFYQCFSDHPHPYPGAQKGTFKMGSEDVLMDEQRRVIGFNVEAVSRVSFISWMYRLPKNQKQSAVSQLRGWHRFEGRIAQAA